MKEGKTKVSGIDHGHSCAGDECSKWGQKPTTQHRKEGSHSSSGSHSTSGSHDADVSRDSAHGNDADDVSKAAEKSIPNSDATSNQVYYGKPDIELISSSSSIPFQFGLVGAVAFLMAPF